MFVFSCRLAAPPRKSSSPSSQPRWHGRLQNFVNARLVTKKHAYDIFHQQNTHGSRMLQIDALSDWARVYLEDSRIFAPQGKYLQPPLPCKSVYRIHLGAIHQSCQWRKCRCGDSISHSRRPELEVLHRSQNGGVSSIGGASARTPHHRGVHLGFPLDHGRRYEAIIAIVLNFCVNWPDAGQGKSTCNCTVSLDRPRLRYPCTLVQGYVQSAASEKSDFYFPYFLKTLMEIGE